MNSLQRVLAMLQGQPVDRPAMSLLLSLYGARLTGASLRDHYSDARVYAEGQFAVQETFGSDLLFSPFAVPHLGEAFGGTLRHHAAQAPTLARPAFADPAEALAAEWPEPEGHPSLRYLLEAMGCMAKGKGGEVVLVGVMLSPVDLPAMLLGAECWMETLLFEPARAQALLERSSGFCTGFAQRFLAAGATVVAFTANFSNPDMMPRRITEALTLPALRAWAGGISGPLVFHHGGYRLAPHLDLLQDIPQLAGYVLDGRDDPAEGRTRVGAAPLLLGGLDGPGLEAQTPLVLRQRCRDLLQARRTDPRFLLASCAADIPLATPPEVLRVVRETVLEFAGPPQ